MSSVNELIKYIQGPSKDIYGIENFHRDRRFAFWYVLSQLATPGPDEDPGSLDVDGARKAVTTAPDGGVDAVFIDDEHCLHLVQSKLRTSKLGDSEGLVDIDYLNRWDVLLGDAQSDLGQVRTRRQRLSAGTRAQLEDAKKKVLDGQISELRLHFVSTKRMPGRESKWELDVEGREPLPVSYVPVGHDRVGHLFENFMAGVPPVGDLTWRVARRSLQQAYESGWSGPDGLRLTHLLIPGDEVRDAVEKYRWQLFARNVRLDLGGENPVNREIRASIRKEPEQFQILNNGLTVTCDESNVSEGAACVVTMNNPQIVNGQQTSWAVHDAGAAAASILIPVKLVTIDRSTHGDGMAQVITTRLARATNRQSGINESDLRSNDACQIDIGHRLLGYELHYSRKRTGGHSTAAETGGKKVITMMTMADAVGNCLWESVAHRNTKEILFTTREQGAEVDYYTRIFAPDMVPRNLACCFLWLEVRARAGKKGGGVRSNTPEERAKEIAKIREQGKWLALYYVYQEISDGLVAKTDGFITYGRTNKSERPREVTQALDGLVEAVLRGVVKFYDVRKNKDITDFFKTKDLCSRFTPFFRGQCKADLKRFKTQRMNLLASL